MGFLMNIITHELPFLALAVAALGLSSRVLGWEAGGVYQGPLAPF